ncbi:MAG TPA: hypothetical protein VHR88_10520 [Solirubrobacteraceae bacterium]|nr:hypothetical protein [Solirubrobacteraceae bacterium]
MRVASGARRVRPARATAVLAAAVLAAALALAGCGGGNRAASAPATFTWLHPSAAAPAGWATATLSSGTATLAYPRGWRRLQSDSGTVSAASVARNGLIVGYLNATPRQANETLSNWSTFRPTHNFKEGDRGVRVLSSATGLRFAHGRGSCVEDTYHTVRAHYREVACLVDGARGQSVVVAAATTPAWARMQGTLRQAVSAFQA